MTKLQIISRLWVHVSDLLLIAVGQGVKTLEDVQRELDITEYACRPYADCDDDELYSLDVLKKAREISGPIKSAAEGGDDNAGFSCSASIPGTVKSDYEYPCCAGCARNWH